MDITAYFDESGDDGIKNYSSNIFVLTSTYMYNNNWNVNYETIRNFRKYLKDKYGILVKEEFHTAEFFKGKNPYKKYNLTNEDKKDIVTLYAKVIAFMQIKIINVIIDKDNITKADYPVLSNALTYNIQRIENDSNNCKYIIISDEGRISVMRKTARAIRNYNPITSIFSSYYNAPIKKMIEDILGKNSKESYFIQISDFVSYVINLYYKYVVKGNILPKRISDWLSVDDIINLMNILKSSFNLKASSSNEYGLVIYPK